MSDSLMAESRGQAKRQFWKSINDNCTVLVFLSIFLLSFSVTNADPDLWGHLKFGQDILDLHRIPTHDLYSYLTNGTKWINHEWLTELVIAFTYKHFSVFGLCLLKVVICLTIITLLYRQLIAAGLTPFHAGFLLLLIDLLILPGTHSIRPQLFTYLFLAITLQLIKHAEGGNYKPLLVLPFLFAVWANLHGGFLSGLVVLLVWSIAHIVHEALKADSWRNNWPRHSFICAAALGSVAAVFLNPYGYELLDFLRRTATVARPDIVEWQPMTISSNYAITFSLMLGLSIWTLIRSKKRLPPPLLIIYVILCLGPLVSVRHLPLFALTFFLIGEQLNSAWNSRSRKAGKSQKAPWPYTLYFSVAVMLFLESVCCVAISIPHLRHIEVDNHFYPIEAVRLLVKSGVTGNMALEPMGWGEYVIWHLSPQIQVSYDGRRETIYSEKNRTMNLNFMDGTNHWNQLLLDYPTDLALVEQGRPTINLMKLDRHWQLVYEDKIAGVFARPGSVVLDKISLVSPPAAEREIGETYFP